MFSALASSPSPVRLRSRSPSALNGVAPATETLQRHAQSLIERQEEMAAGGFLHVEYCLSTRLL